MFEDLATKLQKAGVVPNTPPAVPLQVAGKATIPTKGQPQKASGGLFGDLGDKIRARELADNPPPPPPPPPIPLRPDLLTNPFNIKPTAQAPLQIPAAPSVQAPSPSPAFGPPAPTLPQKAAPRAPSSLDFTSPTPLPGFQSPGSTLQLPTKQQQAAVQGVVDKVDQYQQKKGAVPAMVRTVTGAFSGLDQAMLKANQSVDPETGQKKDKTQRAIDTVGAGLSILNVFPPWLAANVALQGASNIDTEGQNVFQKLPILPVKYAAKGVNAAFEGVDKAKSYVVDAGFDKLVPSTPEYQRFRPLAQGIGSLVAVLAAGKIAHDVIKAPGEFKAKTAGVNDLVGASAKVLDLPVEKNALGQAKPLDPTKVSDAYKSIAEKMQEANQQQPGALGVVSQAKIILDDHATLSPKEFRAKYAPQLEGANAVLKNMPTEQPQEIPAPVQEAPHPFDGLAERLKAKEAAPAVPEAPTAEAGPGKPTFEPPAAKPPSAEQPVAAPAAVAEPSFNGMSNEEMMKLAAEKPEDWKLQAVKDKAFAAIDAQNAPAFAEKPVPAEKPVAVAPPEKTTIPRAPKTEATRNLDIQQSQISNRETAKLSNKVPVETLSQAELPKAPIEPSVSRETSVPERGRSKVGQSIEAKAIEQGLASSFSDTAGYDKVTIKDQARRAADFMGSDIEAAKRAVTGQEKLPEGLRAETLIKAMEDHALKTGDAQLALDIANSPLTSDTSLHAQAMRLMAERDPSSAVAKIQELRKIKEAAAKKKGAPSAEKVVKEIKEKIKSELKPKQTKETWASFVDSITC